MCEIKHTPGPWEPLESTAFVRTDDEYKYAVACVYGFCGDSAIDDVSRANVRLIAAAPDLLALLIELTDIEGPLPGNREWHAKAIEAIAKATGGSHV